MRYLENLFSPLQNCEETTLLLCRLLNVPITRTSLVNALETHPDYPSMLSISDVMSRFGVDNVSFRITDTQNLRELKLPCIVQIKSEKSHYLLFAVIIHVSGNTIDWYNPVLHKTEKINIEYFRSIFTGFVQMYEVSEKSGEKDFSLKRNKEKRKALVNDAVAIIIPILILAVLVVGSFTTRQLTLMSVLYTLIVFVGAATSALLVLYEIDQYNPTLQKVCTGGGKTNCAAILHSDGSKIFDIHWSAIGFSYFMGVLAVLLAGGLFNYQLVDTAAWINVFTLPYTIYSFYYQGRIVKQWCPMCLTVQFTLIALFVVSLFGNFLKLNSISLHTVLPYVVSTISVFIALYLLLPALEKAKASKHYLHSLQQIKHNAQIFEALLAKQKQITEPTDGLGIMLGNPNGKIHLIKVCNPYCGPCARAHLVIEKLLKNNSEIKLQIIFMVTEQVEDRRNNPVKTFLALNQHAVNNVIADALDLWYTDRNMEYEEFSKKYPFDSVILESQLFEIKKMREWCENEKIEATPTFIINNYHLPELYSVNDIEYFLSV